LPEIRYKFNHAVKGEELKGDFPPNGINENNYIIGWSFVSPSNKN